MRCFRMARSIAQPRKSAIGHLPLRFLDKTDVLIPSRYGFFTGVLVPREIPLAVRTKDIELLRVHFPDKGLTPAYTSVDVFVCHFLLSFRGGHIISFHGNLRQVVPC